MRVGKWYRESVIMMKLLSESVVLAIGQLRSDKLRTFLSLFGVSIGIFSIVAIFTAIDSLQGQIREGLEQFGSDVILIGRFPLAADDEDAPAGAKGGGSSPENGGPGEFRWWEYLKRPAVTMEDYEFVRNHLRVDGTVSYLFQSSLNVKYRRNSISGCRISCVGAGWEKITRVDLERGRYFSGEEVSRGSSVAIIGAEVAGQLFGDEDPVGKTIRIGSRESYVIGVHKRQGEGGFTLWSPDNSVLIPVNFGKYMINFRNADGMVVARPGEGVADTDFEDELRTLMRARRRLRPGDKNNFSLNRMTYLLSMVQAVFDGLGKAGWIIAGFSLLIGGFGIANIMFVSVKERTHIIGIQKALGAKRYVIMTQFLTEAAALAVTGGLIGILLVWVLILAVPGDMGFPMRLSLSNVLNGMGIASAIGLAAGLIPARIGAGLDPVIAINAK